MATTGLGGDRTHVSSLAFAEWIAFEKSFHIIAILVRADHLMVNDTTTSRRTTFLLIPVRVPPVIRYRQSYVCIRVYAYLHTYVRANTYFSVYTQMLPDGRQRNSEASSYASINTTARSVSVNRCILMCACSNIRATLDTRVSSTHIRVFDDWRTAVLI